MTIIEDIDAILEALKRKQAAILGKNLASAFVVGFKSAPGKPVISQVQSKAIQALTKEQLGYIAEFNDSLGEQLKDKVKGLMADGKGMEAVKQEIIPYAKAVFNSEENVVISHIGDTRTELSVGKDGTITKIEKVITQEYKNNIKSYSDLVSRNAIHQSIERGRDAAYKASGVGEWIYIAIDDERVRPDHFALLGNHYTYGTLDSDAAEEVMQDFNCRCRKIPYFGDPEIDTPQSIYEQQKEEAGLIWQDGGWAFKPSSP